MPRRRIRPLRQEPSSDPGVVFVVTYGRSGSTLLTGILNSIPGFLIRGENRDAVHHLFLFHQTLATEKARGPQDKVRQRTHPFFGIGDVPLDRSIRQCRRAGAEHRAATPGRHQGHRLQGDPLEPA